MKSFINVLLPIALVANSAFSWELRYGPNCQDLSKSISSSGTAACTYLGYNEEVGGIEFPINDGCTANYYLPEDSGQSECSGPGRPVGGDCENYLFNEVYFTVSC